MKEYIKLLENELNVILQQLQQLQMQLLQEQNHE